MTLFNRPTRLCGRCGSTVEPDRYQDVDIERCTRCGAVTLNGDDLPRLTSRPGTQTWSDAPPAPPRAPAAAPPWLGDTPVSTSPPPRRTPEPVERQVAPTPPASRPVAQALGTLIVGDDDVLLPPPAPPIPKPSGGLRPPPGRTLKPNTPVPAPRSKTAPLAASMQEPALGSALGTATMNDEPGMDAGLPNLPSEEEPTVFDRSTEEVDRPRPLPRPSGEFSLGLGGEVTAESEPHAWAKNGDVVDEWTSSQRRGRTWLWLLGTAVIGLIVAIPLALGGYLIVNNLLGNRVQGPVVERVAPGTPVEGEAVAPAASEAGFDAVEDVGPKGPAKTTSKPASTASTASPKPTPSVPAATAPAAPKSTAATPEVSTPKPATAKPTTTEAAPAAKPSVRALIDRGWNQVDGNPSAARDTFHQALTSAPGNPEAAYGLGYALLQLGRKDEAKQHLCAAAASGDAGTRREIQSILDNQGMSCR